MIRKSSRPVNPRTGEYYSEKSKTYKEWESSLTPEQLAEDRKLQNEETLDRIISELERVGLI